MPDRRRSRGTETPASLDAIRARARPARLGSAALKFVEISGVRPATMRASGASRSIDPAARRSRRATRRSARSIDASLRPRPYLPESPGLCAAACEPNGCITLCFRDRTIRLDRDRTIDIRGDRHRRRLSPSHSSIQTSVIRSYVAPPVPCTNRSQNSMQDRRHPERPGRVGAIEELLLDHLVVKRTTPHLRRSARTGSPNGDRGSVRTASKRRHRETPAPLGCTRTLPSGSSMQRSKNRPNASVRARSVTVNSSTRCHLCSNSCSLERSGRRVTPRHRICRALRVPGPAFRSESITPSLVSARAAIPDSRRAKVRPSRVTARPG